MTIIEGFEARCCDCDARYDKSLRDPSKHKINAQIVNRDIWMTTHYSRAGHHRFMLARVTQREISVARVHDPNQLRLSDDPLYESMRVGPDET